MLAANKVLTANEVGGVEIGNELIEKYRKLSKTGKTSKVQKSSKSRKSAKSKKPSKSENLSNFNAKNNGLGFLTPKARAAFNYLQVAFTKAPILWHFDPECHIRIKTDVSGYTIGGVQSRLASGTRPDWIFIKTDLGQWHLVAFFLKKIFLAKTQYNSYNGELLAIVEVFKIWRYYLKGCKYEVLILTDHNNLHYFMDTKKLSSKQVRWT